MQDALIDTIKRSKIHFVYCFVPKVEAFNSDTRLVPAARVGSSESDLSGERCDAELMQVDVPLLRAQLRGSRLMDALHMYRQGECNQPQQKNIVCHTQIFTKYMEC